MSLIAIATDTVKDISYNWLFAASLPPLFYLMVKKKKLSWLRRLLLKKANSKKSGFLKKILIKRFVFGGGKKMSDGLVIY
jgi:hypothetical protein